VFVGRGLRGSGGGLGVLGADATFSRPPRSEYRLGLVLRLGVGLVEVGMGGG
jgi:hypothetical protein